MFFFRRILIASLITLGLMSPAVSIACGMVPDGVGAYGPVFQTPVSMKGQFVFVNRISRRTLKHLVSENQQPFRPPGLKLQL